MSTNQRALLLLNRHARKGHKHIDDIIQILQSQNLELIEESTEHPQQLPDIIRKYKDQVDLVIIGGGDGTLNAAVDGLIDTHLPLAILPLGTANDLARTLKIPTAIADACQLITTGQTQQIDVGCVNGKHFFNVASLGLSVVITQQLTKETKRQWGVLAYAKTALQALWQARPFNAEIRTPTESFRVRSIQIAIGNGRFYGGGMVVAADAAIDDCRLDLYSLEVKQWWQVIALLPAMWQGQQGKLSGVRSLHNQTFEIYTRRPLSINTDGEITAKTPARFSVIPKAITAIVPK